MKKLILLFLPKEVSKEKFDEFIRQYSESYELCFVTRDSVSDDMYERAVAIIGNPPPDKLRICKKLEWLGIDFAGTDRYIGIVRELGSFIFTNASGAFGEAMAEHMLAVVFELYRNLHLYRDNQNRHIWSDEGAVKSVFHKNVLVVGTGDIGCSFAKIMKKFSCRVTGINTTGDSAAFFDETYKTDCMKEHVKSADIIALCVPANASTDNLFDEETIGLMKRDAVLVNVGRGNCIDDKALLKALSEERIFGAALDVFKEEPLADSKMWDVENLIITPHVSGKTYGHDENTINKVLDICVKNLYRYVEGKDMINPIDLNTGYRKVKND